MYFHENYIYILGKLLTLGERNDDAGGYNGIGEELTMKIFAQKKLQETVLLMILLIPIALCVRNNRKLPFRNQSPMVKLISQCTQTLTEIHSNWLDLIVNRFLAFGNGSFSFTVSRCTKWYIRLSICVDFGWIHRTERMFLWEYNRLACRLSASLERCWRKHSFCICETVRMTYFHFRFKWFSPAVNRIT